MPIKAKGEFYEHHESLTSAGGATEDIDTPKIEQGYFLEGRLACGVNITTGCTRIEIYVCDGIIERKIFNQTTAAANQTYGKNNIFYVPEGKFVRIRFVGNTAADSYEGYVQGILYKVK